LCPSMCDIVHRQMCIINVPLRPSAIVLNDFHRSAPYLRRFLEAPEREPRYPPPLGRLLLGQFLLAKNFRLAVYEKLNV